MKLETILRKCAQELLPVNRIKVIMPMYRILLTGASGTIGTRLFERLLERGYEVIGIDKRYNKWRGELNKMIKIGNLLENDVFKEIPDDIDLVIHLAANARVWALVENPSLALENIIMVYNVLEFMRKRRVKNIIFSSSREVYGNLPYRSPIKESLVKIENCESPYVTSKISGEALIHSWAKVYGIDFIILRFSNVYGMYDDSDRVIPLWIKQTLTGQDLVVYGRDKTLDFVYIDDAVDGIIKAMEGFNRVKGETFNIAYGKGVKLVYIAEKIKQLLNGKNKIIVKDSRPGEIVKFEGDISKARKLLGYNPNIDIDKGLRRAVEWYKILWHPDQFSS